MRLEVCLAVSGHLGRQPERLRRLLASGNFRRDRADWRIGGIPVLVRRDVEPEVEEAIPSVVRVILVIVGNGSVVVVTIRIDRDVETIIQTAVVKRRVCGVVGDLVSESMPGNVCLHSAVPVHDIFGRGGELRRAAPDEDMPAAKTRKACAILALCIKRPGRVRLQELGGAHVELPGVRLQATVLRLDKERDVYLALGIAEIRLERAARRFGNDGAAASSIIASVERDLDAVGGPLRVVIFEVVVRVASHVPPNRVPRLTAGNLNAVRHAGRIGRDDAFRQHVLDNRSSR